VRIQMSLCDMVSGDLPDAPNHGPNPDHSRN